jgi:hypothetical protein
MKPADKIPKDIATAVRGTATMKIKKFEYVYLYVLCKLRFPATGHLNSVDGI